MLVRSICNHYNGTYRKEGAEFEHSGPLYEHIVPAEDTTDADTPQKGAHASRAMRSAKA